MKTKYYRIRTIGPIDPRLICTCVVKSHPVLAPISHKLISQLIVSPIPHQNS